LRFSQLNLDRLCDRVRATKHAPRDPFRILERRHGLAEIVERGGGVLVERHRVTVPRALSATEALVDLKVVEAICDAAAAKSAAGTRVAA
jgi:hypothetical protein